MDASVAPHARTADPRMPEQRTGMPERGENGQENAVPDATHANEVDAPLRDRRESAGSASEANVQPVLPQDQEVEAALVYMHELLADVEAEQQDEAYSNYTTELLTRDSDRLQWRDVRGCFAPTREIKEKLIEIGWTEVEVIRTFAQCNVL